MGAGEASASAPILSRLDRRGCYWHFLTRDILQILNETEITNFNGTGRSRCHSCRTGKRVFGDEDTAGALFAQAQIISEAHRKLPELVQSIA